jgi:cell wall-associated NlpC family hydrolase
MVRIAFLLLMIVFSSGIQSQTASDSIAVKGDSLVVMNDSTLVDSLLHYAQTLLHSPYKYGSIGPKAFDCSGFVIHVFGKYGISLPHGSAALADQCEKLKLKEVQPGDLLFFAGRKAASHSIGHVSIVLSVIEDEVTMIHATIQAGVISEVMQKSEYFKKRFIKAGRLKSARLSAL